MVCISNRVRRFFILLLLTAGAGTGELFPQVPNDNCGKALRICAGDRQGVSATYPPGAYLSTAGATSDGISATCWNVDANGNLDDNTDDYSIWFVGVVLNSGRVRIDVARIDNSCGVQVALFSGKCGALTEGTCAVFGPPSGSMTVDLLALGFNKGDTFYLVLNTPGTCTNGEDLELSITNVDNDAIEGLPRITDILYTPSVRTQCDSGCWTLAIESIDSNGVKVDSVIWDPTWNHTVTSWSITSDRDSVSFCIEPGSTSKSRVSVSLAQSECPIVQVGEESRSFGVAKLQVSAKADTPKCINAPLNLTAQGTIIQPNWPPYDIPECIQYLEWRIVESSGCLGALADTAGCVYLYAVKNDTLVFRDTCIRDNNCTPSPPNNSYGPDTLKYIPCSECFWVEVKAVGTCAPDSFNMWVCVPPPLPVNVAVLDSTCKDPLSSDTLCFCRDSVGVPDSLQICISVDTSPRSGVCPNAPSCPSVKAMPPYNVQIWDGLGKLGTLSSPLSFTTQNPDTCLPRIPADTFLNNASIRTPFIPIYIRVEDSLGCFDIDTQWIRVFNPIIDTAYYHKRLLAPRNDTFKLDCGSPPPDSGWCACDTIPFILRVRADTVFIVEVSFSVSGISLVGNPDWTPAGGRFTRTVTNDTIFADTLYLFSACQQKTDYQLILRVVDEHNCDTVDTFSIPILEPPTVRFIPDACATNPIAQDTFCVEGSCPSSRYWWRFLNSNPPGGRVEFYKLDGTPIPNPNNIPDSCVIIRFLSVPDTIEYLFEAEVLDAVTGCRDTVPFQYIVDTPISVTITPPLDTVCEGDTVTLISSRDTPQVDSLVWVSRLTGAVIARNTDTLTYVPPAVCTTPGSLLRDTVILTAYTGGCRSMDTAIVTVVCKPQINVSATPPRICACDTFSLQATVKGGVFVGWSATPPLWIEFPSNTTTRAVTCQPDTYMIVGTAKTNTIPACTNTDTLRYIVDSIPLPVINVYNKLNGTDTFCRDGADTIIINARQSTGVQPLSFSWSVSPAGAATIQNPTADSTVAYNLLADTLIFCVKVTSAQGCDSTVCDTLYKAPPPQWVATTTCATDTLGGTPTYDTVRIVSAVPVDSADWGASPDYSSIVGVLPPDSAVIVVRVDGADTLRFVAVVHNSLGCVDTVYPQIIITDPVRNPVTLNPDTDTLCATSCLTVTSTKGYQYTWYSPDDPTLAWLYILSPMGDSVRLCPTISTSTAFLRYVAVGVAGGCSDTDTLYVWVARAPLVSVLPDSIRLCEGQVFDFGTQGSVSAQFYHPDSVLWSTIGIGGTFSPSATILTPTYQPLGVRRDTGWLKLRIGSWWGVCPPAYDSVWVKVSPYISLTSFRGVDTICSGDTAEFVLQYEFIPDSVVLSADKPGNFIPSRRLTAFNNNIDTLKFVPAAGVADDTVVVTFRIYSDTCGFVWRDTFIVLASPTITFVDTPLRVCAGDTIMLTATFTGGTGTWSDGGAGGIFIPSPPVDDTVYYVYPAPAADQTVTVSVSLTTQCGSVSRSYQLAVDSTPVVRVVPDTVSICEGYDTLFIASGGSTYIWELYCGRSGDTIPVNNDSVVVIACDSGMVLVTGVDGRGCRNMDTAVMNVLPNPPVQAHASYDSVNCYYPLAVDFSFVVGGGGVRVGSVLWEFGDGSTSSQTSPQHIYEGRLGEKYPKTYPVVLWVTYENGCARTDTVSVTVCEKFGIPNTINPDNPENAVFYIRGLEGDQCAIKIFTRWGNLIYEADPYQNNWNGVNSRGERVPPDVYYYTLKCEKRGVLTGWVKVVR